MKHPKVEVYPYQTEDGDEQEWGWRLIAANGKNVCRGEGHGSPRDAERGFRDSAATMLTLLHDSLEFGANWKIEVVDS
jgi:hypothetical protein